MQMDAVFFSGKWFLAESVLYAADYPPFPAQAQFLLLLIHKGRLTTVNCSANDNPSLL